MNRTVFLYGPQTSGKTTRLLRIIKRDHGWDILMSGEDKARVNNGREVCDVTLRVPKVWDQNHLQAFKKRAAEQFPVKHVLIDGAQFISKSRLVTLRKVFNQIDPLVPIIFAGCRYYIAKPNRPDCEIPVSRFLMHWCDRAVPVDRRCDFCRRIATHLFLSGFKRLSDHKIVAVDPHLVCDRHYRKLNLKKFLINH